MLILTRKKTESVWIGEDIKITIFKTQKGKVVFGIDAPKDIKILREELLHADDKRITSS